MTPRPLAINQVYDTYLTVFSQLYFLKAEQLTRRLYKMGMLTTVQARLKLLTEAGYLHSFHQPTVKSKSAYIYTLAAKGVRHVENNGRDVAVYYKPSELIELSHPWLWHVLELNDFIISAQTLEKTVPQVSLARLHHDLSMKKEPIQVPMETWKNKAGETVTRFVDVWPDTFLDFRVRREGEKPLQYCFWVELDRGTEQTIDRFKGKIRRIVAAILSGKMQEYFGIKHLSAVLFPTTAGNRRVEQMRKWVIEILTDLHAKPDLVEMFLLAPFTASMTHQQVWFDPLWVTPLKEQTPISLLGE